MGYGSNSTKGRRLTTRHKMANTFTTVSENAGQRFPSNPSIPDVCFGGPVKSYYDPTVLFNPGKVGRV